MKILTSLNSREIHPVGEGCAQNPGIIVAISHPAVLYPAHFENTFDI
jgi:hypothetical protein